MIKVSPNRRTPSKVQERLMVPRRIWKGGWIVAVQTRRKYRWEPSGFKSGLVSLAAHCGPCGSSVKAVGKAIGKRFYSKWDLRFFDNSGMALLDYVEHANIQLVKSGGEQQ